MTKKPGPAERRKREYLEDRTHQEDGTDSDAEVLRELGHGLIPSNGDGPEVPD